ncbi:M20 aminoacylase family protein [Burkholderia vietnamiensis]|uniref:M20 aminoacylase family protein n=1 Tax=Burkholderia vietnamiensis TaxID=60552 RepID=UPI0007555D53|nr:M20 aminoacylase family protein [Burkholderia vietnamiensis]KVR87164.1 amidohydrolase [Burkholderia vietnamiensis]KVS24156.1 amidohydrolase [Burkholderia vietnamiensis]MDN8075841.1 M20 aminoacylase family protein [Burkholderia vietnamiensis]HDR8986150.1 amidohydrolase [Burkholderia vietnamiensis]HDR9160159.1 amidohydrolase [Burkholderia vietnamiensis]
MEHAILSEASLSAHRAHWASLRRDLHAHPELRFDEHRTADVVARELAALGYAVSRGLGGTGVVASLPGADPRRGIVLRADLDALPIREANDFAHASCTHGVMHACGHDGHTVMLLGAARVLRQLPQLPGSVHFVFQPGEEGGAGARKMIDDGLFEQFPTEAVFGMHNWPGLPAGHFGLRTGPIMAAGSRFRITVTGKGAHAAQPHLGIDPVPLACAMVLQCQTIAARHKDPVDPAVISVCMFQAGTTDNVIPDSAELRGTIRTLSSALQQQLQRDVRLMCEALAGASGARADVEFFQYYPATVNTPAETALCEAVIRDTFGEQRLRREVPPNMTSEDFGFMLEERPGAYVLIGNAADGDAAPAALHHPKYDFNDDIIPAGVRYWVSLAQRYFARAT